MKIETTDGRFHSFLALSRWLSAMVALMFHARFVLFINYDEVLAKTVFVKGFYFITGLGHEAFTVFFVADGIIAGLLLRQRQQQRMTARDFLGRLVGVYRTLLPGLIVGAALDLLGVKFFNGTGLYSSYPDFTTVTLTLSSFFGNMLILEPFVVPTFGSSRDALPVLLSMVVVRAAGGFFWYSPLAQAPLPTSRAPLCFWRCSS
jgi:hypothetical protein